MRLAERIREGNEAVEHFADLKETGAEEELAAMPRSLRQTYKALKAAFEKAKKEMGTPLKE